MATLGEFGSLLQLGFGVGVGLSFFRAPMDLRAKALSKAIESQFAVVSGVKSQRARERSGKLASVKLEFTQKRRQLELLNLPFMIATVAFALLNLAALIWASLDAGRSLTGHERSALLFISVGSYTFVFLALEIVAQWLFWGVRRELRALNGRK